MFAAIQVKSKGEGAIFGAILGQNIYIYINVINVFIYCCFSYIEINGFVILFDVFIVLNIKCNMKFKHKIRLTDWNNHRIALAANNKAFHF